MANLHLIGSSCVKLILIRAFDIFQALVFAIENFVQFGEQFGKDLVIFLYGNPLAEIKHTLSFFGGHLASYVPCH